MGQTQQKISSPKTPELSEHIVNFIKHIERDLNSTLPRIDSHKMLYVGNNSPIERIINDYREVYQTDNDEKIEQFLDRKIKYNDFYVTADIYIRAIYFAMAKYTVRRNEDDLLAFVFNKLVKDYPSLIDCTLDLLFVQLVPQDIYSPFLKNWAIVTKNNNNRLIEYQMLNSSIYVDGNSKIEPENIQIQNITPRFRTSIENTIVEKLRNCIPLIAVTFGMVIKGIGGHQNAILIENAADRIVLNYYEPHGTAQSFSGDRFYVQYLLRGIELIIQSNFPNKVIIIKQASCPIGIQSYTLKDVKERGSPSYDIGYCQLFSLFWVYLNTYITLHAVNQQLTAQEGKRLPYVFMNEKIYIAEQYFLKNYNVPRMYELVVRFAYYLVAQYVSEKKLSVEAINKIFTISVENKNIWDFIFNSLKTQGTYKHKVRIDKKQTTLREYLRDLDRERNMSPQRYREMIFQRVSGAGTPAAPDPWGRSKTDRRKKAPRKFKEPEGSYEREQKRAYERQRKRESRRRRSRDDEQQGRRTRRKSPKKLGSECEIPDECQSNVCEYDQKILGENLRKMHTTLAENPRLTNIQRNEYYKAYANKIKNQKYCTVRPS